MRRESRRMLDQVFLKQGIDVLGAQRLFELKKAVDRGHQIFIRTGRIGKQDGAGIRVGCRVILVRHIEDADRRLANFPKRALTSACGRGFRGMVELAIACV